MNVHTLQETKYLFANRYEGSLFARKVVGVDQVVQVTHNHALKRLLMTINAKCEDYNFFVSEWSISLNTITINTYPLLGLCWHHSKLNQL